MAKIAINNVTIDEYLQYQELECGLAVNSLAAYRNDIEEFADFYKLKTDFKINNRKVTKHE